MSILSWLINNAPTLILSIIALIVAIKSWYKTRIFYDLDVHTLSGVVGEDQLKMVKEKLNTGKYTIINTYEESHPGNRNTVYLLVGKIKK